MLEEAGSYRQSYRVTVSGYRVRLWRLGARVGEGAPLKARRPVGKPHRVKGPLVRRWWTHELFGTPDGHAPPDIDERDLRCWIATDEEKLSGADRRGDRLPPLPTGGGG